MHTNSRDEALALPTEESVRIALRTQQIVAYESGVTETIDPLAGSYYIESLTNKIEEEAMNYIKKIDELGGAIKAIESGYIQKEIQDAAYNYQMEIESGKRIVVGVNKFQIEEEGHKDILRVDPEVERLQREKLKALKEERDNRLVEDVLMKLKEKANTSENLMPYILDAVKAYATLGEICGVLREVFGEYEQSIIL